MKRQQFLGLVVWKPLLSVIPSGLIEPVLSFSCSRMINILPEVKWVLLLLLKYIFSEKTVLLLRYCGRSESEAVLNQSCNRKFKNTKSAVPGGMPLQCTINIDIITIFALSEI